MLAHPAEAGFFYGQFIRRRKAVILLKAYYAERSGLMAKAVEEINFETKNMRDPMLAYVKVLYYGLYIKGIRLYHKKDDESALFVSMPSEKSGDKYYDTVYFKDKSKKEEFEKTIIDAWNKQKK
jgi:DNA-binding cell septation regulator SpoVG